MRRLLIVLLIVGSAGCSETPGAEESEAIGKTAAKSEQGDVVEFILVADAETAPGYAFGVVAPEAERAPLKLVVLERTEAAEEVTYRRLRPDNQEDPRLEMELKTSGGIPLSGPVAMLAAKTKDATDPQKVYIVFEGSENDGTPKTLVEYAVHLARIAAGGDVIAVGRTFTFPIQGPLQGLYLGVTPDRNSLAVHLPAHLGDRTQPMVVLYDVRPESTALEPSDILMVPQS